MRAGWCGAVVFLGLAAGTLTGLRLPALPLGQVWLAKGTLRAETNAGPTGWRGHPMEIRVHGVPRGVVVEVGAGPLAAAGGVSLAVALVARRGRHIAGHCRGCGYDLRGLGAGMCPECGAASGPDTGG